MMLVYRPIGQHFPGVLPCDVQLVESDAHAVDVGMLKWTVTHSIPYMLASELLRSVTSSRGVFRIAFCPRRSTAST